MVVMHTVRCSHHRTTMVVMHTVRCSHHRTTMVVMQGVRSIQITFAMWASLELFRANK
jgi:hypothetical protein